MEVIIQKSKIMVNSTGNISAYHHEWQKAGRIDQPRIIWSIPVQRWYQYRGGPNKNCHADHSDDKIERVVDYQLYQLPHQAL
ncbi:hypothetical protein DPMN_174501 [Dreissena polymorpha]|uniref:Uncharacterized protein n=1 Tax=Dreissena polymorpha TaxID=45954 RepID=A0A9D4E4R1_DREPO|nr:hypothetical protein DPMN_174501 [Dreissena polymorpha]